MPLTAWILAAALAAPPAPGTSPTLAVEDTLHTEVSEVLVRAPRVTLAEILARVARGEARRESLLVDQSVLVTTRLVRNPTRARDTAQLVHETVVRLYRKKPGKVRTDLLREYDAQPKKRGAEMRVDFGPGMGEDIVNFAFQPGSWREFRYRIVGRDLVGGHVVYRIAFEPRSLLDPAVPSGLVWIDTNDFVIVRQEVRFERSPMPLLLKGIDRLVVERERVGSFWMLKRVLARIELTLPMPRVGRSFDFAINFDQYAINTGLDDRWFAVRPANAKESR